MLHVVVEELHGGAGPGGAGTLGVRPGEFGGDPAVDGREVGSEGVVVVPAGEDLDAACEGRRAPTVGDDPTMPAISAAPPTDPT